MVFRPVARHLFWGWRWEASPEPRSSQEVGREGGGSLLSSKILGIWAHSRCYFLALKNINRGINRPEDSDIGECEHQPTLLYITVTRPIKKGDRPNKVTNSIMVTGSQPRAHEVGRGALGGGVRGPSPRKFWSSILQVMVSYGFFRTKLTVKYEHIFRYLTMQNLQYAFVGGRPTWIRKMNSSESHLIWMSWIRWDKWKCNHIMNAVRPI